MNGKSDATRRTGIAVRLLIASALIAALTAVGVAFRANAATIGFAYLVAILFVALWGGLTTSLVSSIVRLVPSTPCAGSRKATARGTGGGAATTL